MKRFPCCPVTFPSVPHCWSTVLEASVPRFLLDKTLHLDFVYNKIDNNSNYSNTLFQQPQITTGGQIEAVPSQTNHLIVFRSFYTYIWRVLDHYHCLCSCLLRIFGYVLLDDHMRCVIVQSSKHFFDIVTTFVSTSSLVSSPK